MTSEWKTPTNWPTDFVNKDSKLPAPVSLVKGQTPRGSRESSPICRISNPNSKENTPNFDEPVAGPSDTATRSRKPELVDPLESELKLSKQILLQKLKEISSHKEILEDQIQQLADENLQLRNWQIEHQNLDQTENQMAAAPLLDNILVPKIFRGNGDEDAVEWIEFFSKYATFRKLEFEDVQNLMPLFLKGSALEWWNGLTAGNKPTTTAALVTAFKAQFMPSGASKWRTRSELWQRRQRPDEKVTSYIEEMRAIARKLGLEDEIAIWAIVNGLKDEIRPSVIEKNPKNMTELRSYAELSESARSMSNTSTLESSIKRLEARLDGLSINNIDGGGYRSGDRKTEERRGRSGVSRGRRSAEDGSRRTGPSRRFQGDYSEFVCSRCGRRHDRGNCPAFNLTCFYCQAKGHLQVMCRKRLREGQQQQGRRNRSPEARTRSSPARYQQ